MGRTEVSVGEPCAVVSGAAAGQKCHFPFTYLGITYDQCTTVGNNGVAWCATTPNFINGKWGTCDSNCFTDNSCKIIDGPSSGHQCLFPFEYKGVTYNECTTVEN